MGLFKIGSFIRFIPVSIVIGFTNGIAVLIGLSQIKDFLGLNIAKMPADFFHQIETLAGAINTVNPYAVGFLDHRLCLASFLDHRRRTVEKVACQNSEYRRRADRHDGIGLFV